jgi:polyhydroxybutyrate depolymerase
MECSEETQCLNARREIAMRRVLRFFLWGLIVIVALSAGLGVLFGYFVYSPAPEVPRLSGTLSKGTIEVGGLKRTYLTYVPRELPKAAPLVVVMHGSGENGAQMRIETGYGFERLADNRGFAVVYPNAYEGYWDVCSIVGDISANGKIDDVGFLGAVVDKLITEIGVDQGRVFAIGSSRGGSMAFRLALEAPSRFRAVAAVSANVPTPENFKCKPGGQGTSSVMIMNGTKDPLVPFDGGEVNLLGLFVPGGIPGGQLGGVIGGIISVSSSLAAAPTVSKPVPAVQRIRISQGVTQGLLIFRIEPTYPPLAQQARIQGVVVMTALIDKGGNVQHLQVVSGHPLLAPAAIAAVKQWRYKPFVLNGQPLEVETTVTVNFHLRSQ